MLFKSQNWVHSLTDSECVVVEGKGVNTGAFGATGTLSSNREDALKTNKGDRWSVNYDRSLKNEKWFKKGLFCVILLYVLLGKYRINSWLGVVWRIHSTHFSVTLQ